ncbi:hypothetical protein MJO28_000213 [Puccinia striiformis f. sp. tritici]|uniref:Uncharacterized protein n=1 Tax=Puccinia striiformis f. sp. tritici TaxID=168172 RepID=A0ACC0EZD4_9BASI|nr:hypothetical protein MJO28_000213 [Puccinia striiformis f. sp. tritici]KAI7967737.1 hypothetical protein MJO29_001014 [Puccinia striiformis f. sp. tritici]
MVDINTTRAVSKKLKATTSQRGNPGSLHDSTEEENVLNTLIPGEKNPGQIPTDETGTSQTYCFA